MVIRNVGILPQHYTASQPEDGGNMVIRNVGILPQHYAASQPSRPQLQRREMNKKGKYSDKHYEMRKQFTVKGTECLEHSSHHDKNISTEKASFDTFVITTNRIKSLSQIQVAIRISMMMLENILKA
jgi:hypothetical protein